MAPLGHSSVRAALIHQHVPRDRDQAIAKALGTFVRDVRDAAGKPTDGQRPRCPGRMKKTPVCMCVARRGWQSPKQRVLEHRKTRLTSKEARERATVIETA